MKNTIKILDVTNLIPISIKCEINGVLQSVMGYIDYGTFTVVVDKSDLQSADLLESDVLKDLKHLVADHLMDSLAKRQSELAEVPPEVYEQMNQQIQEKTSKQASDYLDPDLSVQLKEQSGE